MVFKYDFLIIGAGVAGMSYALKVAREDCRRRGFAYICGAKLILECLKRGLYPSWDAQNKWSVALAEKLGYHFDHAYQAFEVGPL